MGNKHTRIITQNAAELYREAAERYESLPAFASRGNPLEWDPVSFRELYERGISLATALIDLGVEAREHVGIFGDNRMEWILTDYAVQFCGAADVPRGRDITDDEMRYILDHAGIKVVFVETLNLMERILKLKPELPGLQAVILMDPEADPHESVYQLTDLLTKGRRLRENGDMRAEERIADIQPDDLFTLIYTSGTTGQPKGVMLTHANVMSQMEAIPIGLNCTDRVLSILPVWHILERVIELFSISSGTCTYYSSIHGLREDLVNVEPTFMGSAPRLWESLHKRIMDNVRKSHPVRQALFHIAYFFGMQYRESLLHLSNNKLKLKPVSPVMQGFLFLLNFLRWLIIVPFYGFFNATVLEQIRKGLGSSMKGTISGGGALPPDIDRFFNYIGVPVLEGYGLTETSPVVSVRTEDRLVVGTVGPPVHKTEIRIVDPDTEALIYPNPEEPHKGRGRRGEVWVRGPQVMKGYYRQPELTGKSIIDGWFRTGDLGMITFNDCLKILGRLKSTIVLSNGENIEPEPIELRLQHSRYITQCLIVGQDKRYLTALIEPDLDELKEFGVEVSSIDKVDSCPDSRAVIENEIRQIINSSRDFKSFEKVHDFRFLTKCCTVGDELTNLHKLKRHIVTEKYKDKIEEMYNNHK